MNYQPKTATTSNKHGTQNDGKLCILAQGGGVPENQQKYKKQTNTNANNSNKKTLCFQMRGGFLKNRQAQRLDVYCGILKNGD